MLHGPPPAKRLLNQAVHLGVDQLGFPLEIVELKDGDTDPAPRLLGARGRGAAPHQRARTTCWRRTCAPGASTWTAPGRWACARDPTSAGCSAASRWSRSTGRRCSPADVMGAARPGRKLVLSGDTRPCEAMAEAARQADILIHESTFSDDDQARALETRHSTAREAGRIAHAGGRAPAHPHPPELALRHRLRTAAHPGTRGVRRAHRGRARRPHGGHAGPGVNREPGSPGRGAPRARRGAHRLTRRGMTRWSMCPAMCVEARPASAGHRSAPERRHMRPSSAEWHRRPRRNRHGWPERRCGAGGLRRYTTARLAFTAGTTGAMPTHARIAFGALPRKAEEDVMRRVLMGSCRAVHCAPAVLASRPEAKPETQARRAMPMDRESVAPGPEPRSSAPSGRTRPRHLPRRLAGPAGRPRRTRTTAPRSPSPALGSELLSECVGAPVPADARSEGGEDARNLDAQGAPLERWRPERADGADIGPARPAAGRSSESRLPVVRSRRSATASIEGRFHGGPSRFMALGPGPGNGVDRGGAARRPACRASGTPRTPPTTSASPPSPRRPRGRRTSSSSAWTTPRCRASGPTRATPAPGATGPTPARSGPGCCTHLEAMGARAVVLDFTMDEQSTDPGQDALLRDAIAQMRIPVALGYAVNVPSQSGDPLPHVTRRTTGPCTHAPPAPGLKAPPATRSPRPREPRPRPRPSWWRASCPSRCTRNGRSPTSRWTCPGAPRTMRHPVPPIGALLDVVPALGLVLPGGRPGRQAAAHPLRLHRRDERLRHPRRGAGRGSPRRGGARALSGTAPARGADAGHRRRRERRARLRGHARPALRRPEPPGRGRRLGPPRAWTAAPPRPRGPGRQGGPHRRVRRRHLRHEGHPVRRGHGGGGEACHGAGLPPRRPVHHPRSGLGRRRCSRSSSRSARRCSSSPPGTSGSRPPGRWPRRRCSSSDRERCSSGPGSTSRWSCRCSRRRSPASPRWRRTTSSPTASGRG